MSTDISIIIDLLTKQCDVDKFEYQSFFKRKLEEFDGNNTEITVNMFYPNIEEEISGIFVDLLLYFLNMEPITEKIFTAYLAHQAFFPKEQFVLPHKLNESEKTFLHEKIKRILDDQYEIQFPNVSAIIADLDNYKNLSTEDVFVKIMEPYENINRERKIQSKNYYNDLNSNTDERILTTFINLHRQRVNKGLDENSYNELYNKLSFLLESGFFYDRFEGFINYIFLLKRVEPYSSFFKDKPHEHKIKFFFYDTIVRILNEHRRATNLDTRSVIINEELKYYNNIFNALNKTLYDQYFIMKQIGMNINHRKNILNKYIQKYIEVDKQNKNLKGLVERLKIDISSGKPSKYNENLMILNWYEKLLKVKEIPNKKKWLTDFIYDIKITNNRINEIMGIEKKFTIYDEDRIGDIIKETRKKLKNEKEKSNL